MPTSPQSEQIASKKALSKASVSCGLSIQEPSLFKAHLSPSGLFSVRQPTQRPEASEEKMTPKLSEVRQLGALTTSTPTKRLRIEEKSLANEQPRLHHPVHSSRIFGQQGAVPLLICKAHGGEFLQLVLTDIAFIITVIIDI